ncbi:MAG: transglutaminase domain-containing protein [Planctomycetota bacterium]|nr:MAG: transglutaminase domain-containing protein [Planctomycetota bacterium]
MIAALALAFVPLQDRAAVSGSPAERTGTSFPDLSAAIESAIAQAGDNRAELQRYLAHCRDSGDPHLAAAAEFVVANMPGHGFIEFELRDSRGEPHAFDALRHANLGDAQANWDALERDYGPVEFVRSRFDADLEHATAAFLVEQTEFALRAWRERPWARAIPFDVFCQWILPYRGSNEPLEAWRKPLYERASDPALGILDSADIREAAARVRADVDKRIGFNDLYYLHPTDQSYGQMCASRQGRCEDITNFAGYALRANAIPYAADYTPWWADRDNNHAWEVVLDASGRGNASLSNRAAKVYRKTFARQPNSILALRTERDSVPRWLDGDHYADVTEQYVATSRIELKLDVDPSAPQGIAYLCVFNGGEWRPIAWANAASGLATFDRMGRDVAYLPAWHVAERVVPAGLPFVLGKDGAVRELRPDDAHALALEVTSVRPATPDADSKRDLPLLRVEGGKSYELLVCAGEWRSVGRIAADQASVRFDKVPSNGLYWLVEQGSRKLERIFTLQGGKQVWY